MLLLTIAGVAVIMDLYKMRVKNSWILCSLLAGAGTCLWQTAKICFFNINLLYKASHS